MVMLVVASKNSIKLDVENGYYHVYNRGVEKRIIFEDESDYKVFMSYLEEYLSQPPDREKLISNISFKDTVFKGVPRIPKNYYRQIDLIAYCLMDNHFHLIIQQKVKSSMRHFVHSLLLRYSTYFNKKYLRVGPLFQGRYKAALVDHESYLLHLSRYLHLNPSEFTDNILDGHSSYADYLGLRDTAWVKPKIVLDYFDQAKEKDFKRSNSYREFVEKRKGVEDPDFLNELVLE